MGDFLPLSRHSPIQVITGPDVGQLHLLLIITNLISVTKSTDRTVIIPCLLLGDVVISDDSSIALLESQSSSTFIRYEVELLATRTNNDLLS